MLSSDQLQQRLVEWSSRFLIEEPLPFPSPILLYQSLFGLIHNLKSSIQLSDDPQISGLLETVIKSEEMLQRLAADEMELAPAGNAALRKLAGALDSLESIDVFLQDALTKAIPTPAVKHPLLTQPYAWESLSRARATSTARHGYLYYKKLHTLKLSELTAYDQHLRSEFREFGAVDIVRKLEPKPAPQSTELLLDLDQIIAFPKATTAKGLPRNLRLKPIS